MCVPQKCFGEQDQGKCSSKHRFFGQWVALGNIGEHFGSDAIFFGTSCFCNGACSLLKLGMVRDHNVSAMILRKQDALSMKVALNTNHKSSKHGRQRSTR